MKSKKSSILVSLVLVSGILFNTATAQISKNYTIDFPDLPKLSDSPKSLAPNKAVPSSGETAKASTGPNKEKKGYVNRALKKGLSMSQIACVDQLQIEVKNAKQRYGDGQCFASQDRYIDRINCDNIDDPVLIGKNIVFDAQWKHALYENRIIAPSDLVRLRDNLDKLYDSYVELIGSKPKNGDKVLISIPPPSAATTAAVGHAHMEANIICLNVLSQDTQNNFWLEVAHGSWSRTLMHELAHTFSAGREWFTGTEGCESIAEIFISYALENNTGANYGVPGKTKNTGYTTGTAHRIRSRENAYQQYKNGHLKTFNQRASNEGDAYGFYLQGLVGKVGWETYKKAFRSYDDINFIPTFEYKGLSQPVAAFDFLGRIAWFSNNKDTVLYSLPDNGRLLRNFQVIATKKKLDSPPRSVGKK